MAEQWPFKPLVEGSKSFHAHHHEPLDMPIERFLAMLRFEQRDKLVEIQGDPKNLPD